MQVKSFNAMDVEQIRSLHKLESTLAETKIPWRDIAPQHIIDGLDIITKSTGSLKDLRLTSLIRTTSVLIGGSKLKILETWKKDE